MHVHHAGEGNHQLNAGKIHKRVLQPVIKYNKITCTLQNCLLFN